MDEIIYQKSYQEYKQELDSELQKTAEGFVRIGYLLKVARDTNVLAESGYKTVSEFAEAEYNLNKTQVSRFMSINDRFSEGGYSDKLMTEYQGYGYAKLTIMLQLPDSLNEELSPTYSKNEIQALRDEIAAEETVSDIERMIETTNPNETNLKEIDTHTELLFKAILQLGEDEPDLYVDICAAVSLKKSLIEAMAPAGEKVYSIRVRGIGRLMLVISEVSEDVKLINSRTGEKNLYTWDDVIDAWKYAGITESEDASGKEQWEKRYERKFPKAAVAPVQQNNVVNSEKKKLETKKKNKVAKAPKEKNKEEIKQKQDVQSVESNDIPGQTNIVDDFPQYMPEPVDESVEENAEEQQEPEIIENTEAETVSEVVADTISNVERGYKAAVTNNLNTLNELWKGTNENKIDLMIDTLKDLKWRLEKLQEVQNG